MARTASECSDACDLPLSTTYRKLEQLTEAGLVEEHLRIRRDGKHTNQYRRRVDAVHIGVKTDGGFEIEVEADSDGEPVNGAASPRPR